MKVKILVFPVVLAASIAIAIAYVWPEYGSLREAKSELDRSEATLQSVMEKKKNIESLKGILKDNQDKESLMLSFLPVSESEEKVIDGVNYLASSSGVTLSNLSLVDSKKTITPAAQEDTTAASSSKDVLFSGSSSSLEESLTTQSWATQPKFLETEVNVVGKYENVKTFLEQIYKMEMFNEVASLKIEKQETKNEEGASVDAGSLSATLAINFGHLPEVKIGRNLSAPIFSQSSFNLAPYEKLTSLISKNIPILEVGDQGRENPFLP